MTMPVSPKQAFRTLVCSLLLAAFSLPALAHPPEGAEPAPARQAIEADPGRAPVRWTRILTSALLGLLLVSDPQTLVAAATNPLDGPPSPALPPSPLADDRPVAPYQSCAVAEPGWSLRGLGSVQVLEPGQEPRRVSFGLRVTGSSRVAWGFLTLKDPGRRVSFTGWVSRIELVEGTQAEPQAVRLLGQSAGGGREPFACTVLHPGTDHAQLLFKGEGDLRPYHLQLQETLLEGYLDLHPADAGAPRW